jgi:hypothetical protein
MPKQLLQQLTFSADVHVSRCAWCLLVNTIVLNASSTLAYHACCCYLAGHAG